MKARRALRRTVIVLAAGVAATLAPTPASASSVGQFTFTGSGGFSNGIDYPCMLTAKPCPPSTTTSVKNDAKGLPVVNVTPSGQNAAFYFTGGTCLDTKAAVGKPKTPVTTGQCNVMASGTLRGHCGFAELVGVLTYRSSNGTEYNLPFKAFSIATASSVAGGNTRTNIHGIMAIQHGPGCQNKTSSSFTISGHIAIKDLTP